METKQELKIKNLFKSFVDKAATKVVLQAAEQHQSLTVGTFYQEFYSMKIEDLNNYLANNQKHIKKSKNKKAIKLYDEALDKLMEITSLRNEEDIVWNLFRCNECINDAIYILENNKKGK